MRHVDHAGDAEDDRQADRGDDENSHEAEPAEELGDDGFHSVARLLLRLSHHTPGHSRHAHAGDVTPCPATATAPMAVTVPESGAPNGRRPASPDTLSRCRSFPTCRRHRC